MPPTRGQFHRHAHNIMARRIVDRPRGRPYERRPGGPRAGSPPSPPPRLIRPIVRLLPRSPRLSGPGPHQRPHRSGSALSQARFRPQLLPSRQSSGTQLESHGDVARGSAPLVHCPSSSRGTHWLGQGREVRAVGLLSNFEFALKIDGFALHQRDLLLAQALHALGLSGLNQL